MQPHSYQIEMRPAYLLVRQSGTLSHRRQVLEFQRAVESSAVSSDRDRVLFDNRETLPPAEELRKLMFDWATKSRFERVALVVSADLKVIRANMDSIGRARRLRAFSDVESASRWLRRE